MELTVVVRYYDNNLTSNRRAPRRHNRPAASGEHVYFGNSIDEIAHRTRYPFWLVLFTTFRVYHYIQEYVKRESAEGIC